MAVRPTNRNQTPAVRCGCFNSRRIGIALLFLAFLGCASRPVNPIQTHDPSKWKKTPADEPSKQPKIKLVAKGVYKPKIILTGYMPGVDREIIVNRLRELESYYTSVYKRLYETAEPEPEVKKALDKIITITFFKDADAPAGLSGKLNPYREAFVNFDADNIGVVYSGSWPGTRDKILPALTVHFLRKVSPNFPAWVEEGLHPVFSSGEFVLSKFVPVPISKKKIEALYRMINDNNASASKIIVNLDSDEFTREDRLTAFGIVWWLMEKKSPFFTRYFNLVRMGKIKPDEFSKMIKGDFDKLDVNWRKWAVMKARISLGLP